ncbi:hypothetical protein IG631_01104 [Alternaria alternata]|nr:hypothetical protein IG631_01104 [Alternaria alternata]
MTKTAPGAWINQRQLPRYKQAFGDDALVQHSSMDTMLYMLRSALRIQQSTLTEAQAMNRKS